MTAGCGTRMRRSPHSRVIGASLMTSAHGRELADGVSIALLRRRGGVRVVVDDTLPAEENRVVVALTWSLREGDVVDIVVPLRQRMPAVWVRSVLLWHDHTSLSLGVRIPENRGPERDGLLRHIKATSDAGRCGNSEARRGQL